MGIQIANNHEGSNFPCVVCDICGKPIIKADHGMYFWTTPRDSNHDWDRTMLPVHFAHKGCERDPSFASENLEAFPMLLAQCLLGAHPFEPDKSFAEANQRHIERNFGPEPNPS